jgi:hypothetical protein
MLAEAKSHNIVDPAKIEQVESHLLDLPQVECPVVHHFGPGIYIREVTLPAGTLAIGHAQRFEHLNIMLTGAVAMVGDDGQTKVLRAPMIFVGKPGRKLGYVLETCIWQNVYATDERDIDKLESMFLDKSSTWQAHAEASNQLETYHRREDREDFDLVVKLSGFAHKTVRAQSENPHDQIPMPEGFAPKFTVRDSAIEGKGVFLSTPVEADEVIAPARIDGFRTPAGRYTNHAKNPNAKFIKDQDGNIWLVALRRIAGCSGGNQGEEVTVDYRQALALSGINLIEGESQ